MSRILTLACIVALASGGAVAQQGNPPAAAPGNPATTPAGTPHTAPGMPAPDQLNDSDRLFSDALAAGGMAEVEAGKLASRVTGNPMVRQFGELMIQDHSKANKQLMEVAAAAKVPLPGGPDTEHRAVQQQLEQLHGAALMWPMSAARSRAMRGPYSSWSTRSGRDRTRVSKASLQRFCPS